LGRAARPRIRLPAPARWTRRPAQRVLRLPPRVSGTAATMARSRSSAPKVYRRPLPLRARANDGEPLPGVYAVRWIKRGATGILGTNKRGAERSAASPRISLRALPPPRERRPRADRRAARRAQTYLVTIEGWRTIDAHEIRQGHQEQRPTTRIRAASPGGPWTRAARRSLSVFDPASRAFRSAAPAPDRSSRCSHLSRHLGMQGATASGWTAPSRTMRSDAGSVGSVRPRDRAAEKCQRSQSLLFASSCVRST
jgi:hypothetical protein